MRIFDVPIDNKKQVLTVLPSLFEEFIDITNLKFYVKELSKERYLSFAYDENKIFDAIINSGLELAQVKKIYFSQIEFLNQFKSQSTNYIKVDDVSISLSKDIIVKIPDNMKFQIENILDVNEIILSKESISISTHSKYIDDKTSNTYSILLFLLSILLVVKIVSNYNVVDTYEEKVNHIKNIDNKSFSSIQLKSIIKKYDKIYSKELQTRELLFYVLELSRVVNIEIQSLELEVNKIQVKIKDNTIDKSTENKIKQYMKKKNIQYSLKRNPKYILLEVQK